jgi:hypothetical protein
LEHRLLGSKIFRDFSRSLLTTAVVVPRLLHPNHFDLPFTCQSPYHLTLYALGSKQRRQITIDSLCIIIIIIVVVVVVSCHRPFLPVNSSEPTVIPTAQASNFILWYFPYYV